MFYFVPCLQKKKKIIIVFFDRKAVINANWVCSKFKYDYKFFR